MADGKVTTAVERQLEGFFKAGKVRDEVLKWLGIPAFLVSWVFLQGHGAYLLGFAFLVPVLIVLWNWYKIQDIFGGTTFILLSLGGLFVACGIGAAVFGVSVALPSENRLISESNLVSLAIGASVAWTFGLVMLCLAVSRRLLASYMRVFVLDISTREPSDDESPFRTGRLMSHSYAILRDQCRSRWLPLLLWRLVAPQAFPGGKPREILGEDPTEDVPVLD
jgi:hypothetical protein